MLNRQFMVLFVIFEIKQHPLTFTVGKEQHEHLLCYMGENQFWKYCM